MSHSVYHYLTITRDGPCSNGPFAEQRERDEAALKDISEGGDIRWCDLTDDLIYIDVDDLGLIDCYNMNRESILENLKPEEELQ